MPGKAKRESLGRYCVTSFYIHVIEQRIFHCGGENKYRILLKNPFFFGI